MAMKPNYAFERRERDRKKAIKAAQKAEAKREASEQKAAENAPPGGDDPDREG
ncbi:hypothetical protein [Phenylobacterium sp.]|uniref:hypothetical protein n=1 Tax=Phenylobacterium sp. TaxID=1871053 RepID=UPI002DF50548|nr:hypothetical protein [Phenylobacterium sp.]